MISSCAAERFCAQRVPLPLAVRSASACWRASSRAWRVWHRPMARAAPDLGDWPAIAASSSSSRRAAGLRTKRDFRGLASASASVIADFLQLVEGFDRLFGGHLVGSDVIERQVYGVRPRRHGSGTMSEKWQIV